MRRIALVAVLALSVAGTAAAAGGPTDTLKKQDASLRAGKFQALYQLYSPRFRAKCPFATWVEGAPEARAALAGITLKVLGANISQGGGTALVAYEYRKAGKVVYSTHSDLYVNINGKWYDELDKQTTC